MTASNPFEGFPPAALQFLADLKKNNDREWFTKNRDTFDNDVIAPAKGFIVSLGEALLSLHPAVGFDTSTNGSGTLFRIHRDVRFSKDKSPYKTYIGMKFWLGKNPKKTENPGFYVGVGADGAGVYSGMWNFPKPMLEQYRKAIDDPDEGALLTQILEQLESQGYEIGEQDYKRVPRGFEPDHPSAELLKRKGVFAAKPKIEASIVTSADFVPIAFEHCRNMWPMVEWIHEHVA